MLRKKSTLWTAGLVLMFLFALPGTAGAFFFFSPFWGSGLGNNWGWGGPNYYGFGGPWGYGNGPYYPSYGAFPNVFNPYGFGYNSWSYSGPITMPGWIASGYSPRFRSSLYPALPVDSASNNDVLIIPASSPAPDDRARLEIQVPVADARVWLDGVPMTQTGLSRRYVTPPLDPNSRYSYEVKVRWRDDRGQHEETRRVSVRANTNPMVAFTSGEK
jgi:uncharacterized protein (TIGR03000 family)